MNLYVHFPFCRSKCAYCALHSKAGTSSAIRASHVAKAVADIQARFGDRPRLSTVYFGGGSPALCDLSPFQHIETDEFTVELHPLDATDSVLNSLERLGVNRVSMGIQSFDDATLALMGRGHSASDAANAFRKIAARFPNSGFDMICGLPTATNTASRAAFMRSLDAALALAPRHISCYSLIREPKTKLDIMVRHGKWSLPDDDETMDALRIASQKFASAGLARYEISNWAVPGFECRHNLAVWRGEDYVGIGEGARGREGLVRTFAAPSGEIKMECLSPEADARERAMFRLRLAEGMPAAIAERFGWTAKLASLAGLGIVRLANGNYSLTMRGTEVCDAAMAELAS